MTANSSRCRRRSRTSARSSSSTGASCAASGRSRHRRARIRPFVSFRGGMGVLVDAIVDRARPCARSSIGRARRAPSARTDTRSSWTTAGARAGRRRPRRAGVRGRRASRRARPRAVRPPRGDPVRVLGDRHARVRAARRAARRVRLRRPARGGIGRSRLHVVVEQVGGPRARGIRARPRLPRPLRRARRHRGFGRRARRARARRASPAR